MSCNYSIRSFIGNLWRVLLLGNHLKSKGQVGVGVGEEKVTASHSKSLSKSERNYCMTRKERLAVKLLGTYDPNIQHCSGMYHGIAYTLSRRPCGDCQYYDRAKQKGRELFSRTFGNSKRCLKTDGDSLTSHRIRSKPLSEGQEFQNGSSSSTKAFVVMVPQMTCRLVRSLMMT